MRLHLLHPGAQLFELVLGEDLLGLGEQVVLFFADVMGDVFFEDFEAGQPLIRVLVSLFEVAAGALGDGIPSDLRGRLMGISDETMSIPSYAYTSAVCEVEVDPETGLVEVVRYASVDDCGRAVNPLLIHGQSHGGIAQGIGQALWEQCVYDPRSGQLLSGSLLDYALPRADLLPRFDTEISEVPSTTNPLGMRGGSEGGITPGLAAVANAVVDALAQFGVEHIELPATPERVWNAIRAAGRNGAEQRESRRAL